MKPKRIAYETLDPDEVQRLPKRVRDRLAEGGGERDEWVIIHAPWPFSHMVDRLNLLGGMSAEHLRQRAAPDLDRMLTWLASDSVDVEEALLLDNLAARRKYLADTPTLTSKQIHRASGLGSRNTSEPASRWKKEGKTFAVRLGKRDLYPAFQFLDGQPRTGLRDVLAALPTKMTAWQKALWFASGNGWLDGDPPQRRLNDAEQVVEAARRLSEPARG